MVSEWDPALEVSNPEKICSLQLVFPDYFRIVRLMFRSFLLLFLPRSIGCVLFGFSTPDDDFWVFSWPPVHEIRGIVLVMF
jgi:hypothetical protein